MKEIIKASAFVFFLLVIVLLSCNKVEYSCEGCKNDFKTPVASAGSNQVIILPKDSTVLDGSTSYQPGGHITYYRWTKIFGPASFVLTTPDSSKTSVRDLLGGVYSFELNVRGSSGLVKKDTVRITVQ